MRDIQGKDSDLTIEIMGLANKIKGEKKLKNLVGWADIITLIILIAGIAPKMSNYTKSEDNNNYKLCFSRTFGLSSGYACYGHSRTYRFYNFFPAKINKNDCQKLKLKGIEI